ncbi:hypothetical protein [Phytohalomonas tamaricis]|uniref:hypothetical protein n=1 Tax=Phytohalomonas tamaricis TaxID=2081032 RepID=UPI000D0B7A7E|nr:hypothetical protein [Phytohalomonas tamaricis]
MAVNYPKGLPLMMVSGKSRSQAATYRMSDPAVGPGYVERLTENTPVFWSFSLTMTREQANIFRIWLESPNYCDKGLSSFIMPVKTEEGLVEHELRFTVDGYPQLKSETGNILTYGCECFAKRLVREFDDDVILEWSEQYGAAYPLQFEYLDRTVNKEWPDA